MIRIFLVPWILVLMIASSSASAVVINVPANLPTIQLAIEAAAMSGDEIIVAPGTYPKVINFNDMAISLHSASGNPGGPADTIIDGTGLGQSVLRCISGEGAGTILEGFTITGGNAGNNRGIYNTDGNPQCEEINLTYSVMSSVGRKESG